MPVLDSRQLIFDRVAIVEALTGDSRVLHELKLPPGVWDGMALLGDEQAIEIMHHTLSRHSGDHVEITHLNASQIAAALIAYCIRSRIPVPRNCEKRLAVHDGHITLTFTKRIKN